jgi:cytochrome c5
MEFPANTWAANLDQPTLFQETRYLTPGKYKIHITVEDNNAQSIGVQDVALDVPRFADQLLQASSMILAYSVTDLPPRMLGTDMFALGEKRVKPNASGVFRSNENLNVWQEIYGLTVDQATRKPSATFEMVISQNKKEITKLLSDSKEFTGSGLEFIAPGFLQMKYINSVPLADLAPGQYDVQIKATDNLAKTSLVTVGKFSVIAAPTTQSPPSRLNAGSAIFYRACNTCHKKQVMNSQNFATKEEYSALVGREVSKGASVTRDEIPILVDYLFDTYGKKPDTYVPSDIPLQRQ